MAQVLVRDLDSGVVERLKARAERNRRSLQGELRLILEQAARAADFEEQAARVRARLAGRSFSDSAELIREDRER